MYTPELWMSRAVKRHLITAAAAFFPTNRISPPLGEGSGYFHDVLCLWPPRPFSKGPPLILGETPCPSIEPWCFKDALFPVGIRMKELRHHVKFTSESHAFWADLMNGVLCCRCSEVLFGDDDSVRFSFIELPPGCECDNLDNSDTGPAEMFRTIGCTSDGSIKFVSIDFDDSVPDKEKTMTMWTLNMASREWIKDEEISLGALWELDDFNKNGLPKTQPLYPLFLRKEEDDTYTFYFVLTMPISECDKPQSDAVHHHMCRFDMRSKRIESSPLPWAPGRFYVRTLVRSEFFRYLKRPVPDCGKGKKKSVNTQMKKAS
uniref:DUF1618 domain-containing protein n=1 Tax=Leersia perrieri TaxID=77586 RepID=A0A0D9VZJ0_9ORYZ